LMGLSSVALVMLIAVDLVRLGAWLWMRFRVWRHRRAGGLGAPADPGRRGFFGQLAHMGVVGTASGVAGFGFFEARRTPDVVEVEVPIAGLPAALDGFRIVQLTDIHVGPTIRGDYLRRCVEVANSLSADIIAVTGDLIDGFVPMLRDEVAPLGALAAKEGVFFVTGNHEYYWDGPAWCDEVARLGLTVLCNEHRVIDRDGARLLLAGVTDISAGTMVPEHGSDPTRAKAGAPECDVRVLLAHQPRSVFAAAKAGYDLQISGHTHGGQYFPMNLLVYLAQPYVAGLERHDDMWIYVSRGTGYWGPPSRVGAPAEITLLRLRAA
ncbi:MAG TPA: metallophosphoesterase, partial [Nannocystaceae bacterium]|nr:metallophosphoesterase [Nannocystaceae bacterium]